MRTAADADTTRPTATGGFTVIHEEAFMHTRGAASTSGHRDAGEEAARGPV
jgi:hypothetical protein